MSHPTSPALPPKVKDITGVRFGRLVAVKFLRSERNGTIWQFQCDCGKTTEATSGNFIAGRMKSCGCWRREQSSKIHTKHGMARDSGFHPLYKVWVGMKRRCEDEKATNYRYYGGRGIKVLWSCLEEFYQDMSPTWKPGLTIDRINNDGHYEKSNCRWATQKEQVQNQRPRK